MNKTQRSARFAPQDMLGTVQLVLALAQMDTSSIMDIVKNASRGAKLAPASASINAVPA